MKHLILILSLLLSGCAIQPNTHPHYIQQEGLLDCGAAAGAMLAAFAGEPVTVGAAKQLVGRSSLWSRNDIAQLLAHRHTAYTIQHLNAVTTGLPNWILISRRTAYTIQHLNAVTTAGTASAVLIEIFPSIRHWVVVSRYTSGLLQILDPSGASGGLYYWTPQQLQARAAVDYVIQVRIRD